MIKKLKLLKKLFLFTFLAFFIFTSCDNEVDVIPPTLTFQSLSPNPSAAMICGTTEDTVFVLTGGEELAFTAKFQDNNQLSQYKIDIHHNFDCHGHGGASAPGVSIPNVSNQTEDLTVLVTSDLNGVEETINYTLNIPSNVTAGNYHFHVQVIDEYGNDSPFSNFYSLKISNPLDDVLPQITVNQPTGSFSIVKGQKVRFEGKVTDNRSLSDGGNGVVFLSYTDLNSGNTFTTNEVFVFDNTVSTEYDFDFEYTVPVTLVNGNYLFTIHAQDGVRNVANSVAFDVEVTN